MTRHRLFSTPVLCLLTSGSMTLNAQHERRHEEPRPDSRQEQHESRERAAEPRRQAPRELERPAGMPSSARPARPEPQERAGPSRPFEGRPADRIRPADPPRTREAARAWQARQSWRQGAWPARATWQEHRAHRWENEHRTWSQRGGYGGYRIPEAQFARGFGARHPFRIGSRPVIFGGYPRFRCGGFWFLIVDPWPEFWADDWYLWDDLYIDHEFDGYYLLDRHRPGVRLALMVSL